MSRRGSAAIPWLDLRYRRHSAPLEAFLPLLRSFLSWRWREIAGSGGVNMDLVGFVSRMMSLFGLLCGMYRGFLDRLLWTWS